MKRISTPETVPLREGDEPSVFPTAEALRGKALGLLTRREHSRVELQCKLSDQGGRDELIDQVLDELVERRLQSDERFAEVFVRSRAEKGYGPRAIAADLRTRGLEAEAVEAALAESGYDWTVQAIEVRQRRFGRALPLDVRERARQLRFLQYRGFTGAQVARALNCDELSEE